MSTNIESINAKDRDSSLIYVEEQNVDETIYRTLQDEVGKNKILNLKKKSDLKDFKRINDYEKDKDMTIKQQGYTISRLKI